MKIRSLAVMLAGLSVVLGSAIANPAKAQTKNNNTYYCAQLDGNWNTFVNTPRGRVTLINWANKFSETWTPQKRCSTISQRFQNFLDDGNLKFIRTGEINKMPVLCVANARGGACPEDNVLITLKPGTDPEGVLIRLVDFRRSVSGQTLTLSADDAGFYSGGEFYVDMDKFIESVPVNN
ncbi:COP23 domain-containing protein [Waterburya agarophytonicola K14]|uniref:COP23 domain-containing protein n=1 Tax=Waterburya agarophytonicola KI4 TaxID=2874699 RepID=A0A964BQP0_9CYAN|nr:COP23 domain-containing protein [Waterburya agarophytonicola]MCC0176416.1 COP23 domain-containing protein [Waterburya agarophytonicola KI4]